MSETSRKPGGEPLEAAYVSGHFAHGEGGAVMADVGVVIAAHNAAATIGAAVASALAQTQPPAEVVVVADACSDDTAALALRAGARVLTVELHSAAAARNRGARLLQCRWIAFLDGDDVWLPSWLGAVGQSLAAHPGSTVAYGRARQLFADGRSYAVRRRAWPAGDVFATLLTDCFVTTSAVVVERATFFGCGGFDESFGGAGVEDYDCWLRLATASRFAPVEGEHVLYRRAVGSAQRDPTRFLILRQQSLDLVERALASRPVPRTLAQRAVANVYRMSAERFFAVGDGAGRRDLLAALRRAPTDRRLVPLLLAALLPGALVRRLVELRRRWRAKDSAASPKAR